MNIIFGFKTHNRNEAPEVVYCGMDADEGQKALQERAGRYVRAGKLPAGFLLIPVQLPEKIEAQPEAAPTKKKK